MSARRLIAEGRDADIFEAGPGRVLPDRIFVAGMGERQPIADNATAAGRAQNRRVEIILRPLTQ